MKSLAILSTPSISTPQNGLSTNSSPTVDGSDAFKQVLAQKAATEPKQPAQPTQGADKTTASDRTANANDQADDADQVDDQATDNVQMLELNAMSVNNLKAHLQTDRRVSSKKESDTEVASQASDAASLVASLQLPAMGVKPMDTAVEKPATSGETPIPTENGTAQSITAHQKVASTLEDKLASQEAKVDKWEGRDSPNQDFHAMSTEAKAEKFSEQVNAKIAEKIQAFSDKETAYAVGKSMIDASPKFADTLPTLQAMTTSSPLLADVTASSVIKPTVGQTGWNEAVNQKVVWMVGAQEQSATLTLNPPDMGPLQVVVSVNNDKADTTFITDNPEVRKALQDGLSDLRNQLDQAGVTLGQANVSTNQQYQDFRQSNGERFSQQQPTGSAGSAVSTTTQSANERKSAIRETLGLVDTFA